MLRYLDLENADGERVSLHDPLVKTRALVSAEGLVGLPAPRAVVRPRPGGHGSRVRTKHLGDRLIVLEGEVWGSSQAASFAEFDAIQGALYDALDTGRLLRYRRGDEGGTDLQTVVRLDGDVKVKLQGGGSFIRYQATLRAPDPRAYSQDLIELDSSPMGDVGGGSTFPMTFPSGFTPGSAGERPLIVAGTTGTPPVLRLHGRLLDPRIQWHDGRELILNGEVAAGHFLEIDVDARTIRLDGDPAASRLFMLDFAESRWAELPRGVSMLRLLAADADEDAYLTVSYRHAYA